MNLKTKPQTARTLTINAAMKVTDDQSLFVRNVSGEPLLFSVNMAQNTEGSGAVNVANTWIPLDLSTQAERHQILTSTGFRKFIERGYLQIIVTEEALQVFANDPLANTERRRLNRVRPGTGGAVVDEQVAFEAPKPRADHRVSVTPRVRHLISLANNETNTADDTIALLKSIKLSAEDSAYIMANCQIEDIRTQAADIYAEQQAQ